MTIKQKFLDLEKAIMFEMENLFPSLGFEKDSYTIHNLTVNWIMGKVELSGYSKTKGDEFFIVYDYDLKNGTLQFFNDSYNTKISAC